MKISILEDWRVKDNKAGFLGEVDDVFEFDSLDDLKTLATNHHIVCSTLDEMKRNKNSFLTSDFFHYDFDKGLLGSKEIHDTFKDITHIIMGSKNHMKDKGDGKGAIERFHIFIPTNTIADLEEYHWKSKYLLSYLGIDVDMVDHVSFNPAQYWYKHPHTLFIYENEQFDNTEFDIEYQIFRRENDTHYIPHLSPSKHIGAFNLKAFVESNKAHFDKLQSVGDRFHATNTILGKMKSLMNKGVEGISYELAEQMILDHTLVDSSYDVDTRKRNMRKIWDTPF